MHPRSSGVNERTFYISFQLEPSLSAVLRHSSHRSREQILRFGLSVGPLPLRGQRPSRRICPVQLERK